MESLPKRLIVDMDGVLANVCSRFLDFEEAEIGFRQPMENLMGRPEAEVFKNERKYVLSKGFFRDAPVMEGSVAVMKDLNKKYELFVVSAAMEFPLSLPEKHEWLAEHFSFISWTQIVFCGTKTVIRGDIMIDDHYKNLDFFDGQTILFTQPHNVGSDNKTHTRVDSWREVSQMLL